jgi:hypothetical protein
MKGLVMSKKNKIDYKNLKINEENLAITKIGDMPSEEKSPIFLLIVFGIFLIFVFFLPNIVDYITSSNQSSEVESSKETDTSNTTDLEEEQEITYYDISATLSITLEDTLKLDNFNISNNTLSFRITNNGDSRFNFNDQNYFIEIYNQYNTLLERVIMDKDSISKDSSKDYSYEISSTTAVNASKIIFVTKDEDDYPVVNLTTNENGEEVLTCSKDSEEITYNFKDDKLITITDILNYTKTTSDLTYQNDLALWQSKVATYNNISGISSSFVESANGFVVNTVVDVLNAKIASASNDYYYSSDTEGKVVSFEMEARGFSCK